MSAPALEGCPQPTDAQHEEALAVAQEDGLAGLARWVVAADAAAPQRRAAAVLLICLPPRRLKLGQMRICGPCRGGGVRDQRARAHAVNTAYIALREGGMDSLRAWRRADAAHPVALCGDCAGLGRLTPLPRRRRGPVAAGL